MKGVGVEMRDGDSLPLSTAPTSAGPLVGIRVLDLTTSYAGPTASMYLADLGAEVIKVERPGVGDDAREWRPPGTGGMSAWFVSANRSKRSVVIDLRTESGQDLLLRLVDGVDVLLVNLLPGKLASLGLAPDALRLRNPRLVYCVVSGFGLDGPDRDSPGYDLIAQARSGLMSVTGAAGGVPQRVSTALSDIATGMAAGLAICAALVRQRLTGVGELIDVSLLDTDLALMAPRLAAYLAGDPEPRPSGGTDSVLAVYQRFSTADDDIVVAIGNDAIWHRFCAAVGLDHLSADEQLADNAGRRDHRDRIVATIAECLLLRTSEDWLTLLRGAGVPTSRVQFVSQVVADPQVRARGSLLTSSQDAAPTFSVRSPFRLGSMPEPRNEPAPRLGADTVAVLKELGLDDERIAYLLECGAVEATRETSR